MATVHWKEQIHIAHHRGKGIVKRQVIEDIGQKYQSILARIVQFIWLSITALEALLGIRVLLKLATANPNGLLPGLCTRPVNGS